MEDYAIPPCHTCSFRLAAGTPIQVQACGTWNAGFNFRDMTSICNPVIFSFTFDISILCIFFPFPPSTSAVGKHVLVCGSFQMASSCSDLDLSVYSCCPHSFVSLSYQLQILKYLFPTLMIYSPKHHSKKSDLMVFSYLQAL